MFCGSARGSILVLEGGKNWWGRCIDFNPFENSQPDCCNVQCVPSGGQEKVGLCVERKDDGG